MEFFAKAQRKNKKDRHQNDQQQRQQKSLMQLPNLILPSQVKPKKKNNNQNYLNRATHNLNKVKYYNFNKKGYFLSNCIKFLKH